MIILTSFRKATEYEGVKKYSVARFQPQGTSPLPSLRFLAAVDRDGKPLHLDDLSPENLEAYRNALRDGYKARWGAIKKWLDSLSPDEDIVLCCWCPYSKSAQKQIEKYGRFFCHTSLIKEMLNKHRPDILVVDDEDRASNPDPDSDPDLKPGPGAVVIYSSVLGEEIIIAGDRNVPSEGRVVYLPEEVEYLKGLPEDALMAVHRVKKVFGGRVEEVYAKE